MSDRLNYYFRQKVTEAELDLPFTLLEQADRDLSVDLGLVGIVAGAAVTQNSTPNLTVNVAAGTVYDKAGKRITWATTQNVNVAVDELGASTAVSTPGNSKIISVFAKFKRVLTDPRTDGNGATVYFSEEESFEFVVRQGTEGTSPAAPTLDSTMVLICDITRTQGVTTILNSAIDTTGRREDWLVQAGSPRSLRSTSIKQAIIDVLGHYNAHVGATQDKHNAIDIVAAIAASWADSTGIAATNVDAVLEEIVSDLAATAGAARIGASNLAAGGAYGAQSMATVQAGLQQLFNLIDGASGVIRRVRDATGNITMSSSDHTVYIVSGAPFNITLPAAASGKEITIKDLTGNLSTNAVTLVRPGSETIEGIAANYVLQADYGAWTFRARGTTAWWLV